MEVRWSQDVADDLERITIIYSRTRPKVRQSWYVRFTMLLPHC
jgi:hypothetical protein